VIRLFGNALFTVLFSLLFGTTLMDTLNGYKAFRREVVSGYKPRAAGFDVEIEIVAKAIRKGIGSPRFRRTRTGVPAGG